MVGAIIGTSSRAIVEFCMRRQWNDAHSDVAVRFHALRAFAGTFCPTLSKNCWMTLFDTSKRFTVFQWYQECMSDACLLCITVVHSLFTIETFEINLFVWIVERETQTTNGTLVKSEKKKKNIKPNMHEVAWGISLTTTFACNNCRKKIWSEWSFFR